MFWAPYSSNELKTIEEWFEKSASNKNERRTQIKHTLHAFAGFFKSLFFDKALLKNHHSASMNKNMLNKYLQEGKLSLREYLHLSR